MVMIIIKERESKKDHNCVNSREEGREWGRGVELRK